MGIRAALAPDRQHLAATVARPGRPAGREAGLLLIDLARGEIRRLLDDVDLRGRPVWSADGNEIAVRRVHAAEHGTVDEIVAVTVTGDVRPLARGDGALGMYAAGWPAEGLHILRIAAEGSRLGVVDSPDVVLSAGAVRDVSVSPDGRWIAFSDYSYGPALGLLGPGGLTRTPLAGPFVHPAWRPDGTLLVAGAPGRAESALAAAPVPVVSVPSSPGTVSLPVTAGRAGWLAARTVRLGAAGAVVDEWIDLIGPDGRRQPVRLPGVVEPLGWAGE